MKKEELTSQDRLSEYRKTVRIFGIRKGKFLEFDYTVGCEELTVELIMPYGVFAEFCETNHVAEIKCAPDIKADFEKLGAQTNIIQLGEFR